MFRIDFTGVLFAISRQQRLQQIDFLLKCHEDFAR